MEDLYSRIKIVPLQQCLAHEGIVERWVDQIAFNILNEGVMKNPVIVTYHDPYYVVLDGMHRYAAIKQLGVGDILACEVDYFSDKIGLEGWDALVFQKLEAKKFLENLFPPSEGYTLRAARNVEEALSLVRNRKTLLAVLDRQGECWLLDKGGMEKVGVESLCVAADRIDRSLHEKGLKTVYVDNSLTLKDWPGSDAQSLILRPQFTKQEVIERTLHQKLFPPKSTRHLIPERPLRVDLDLSLLRASIDLETKNRVLKDHLKWCYENNRVRYYPESVHIFAD